MAKKPAEPKMGTPYLANPGAILPMVILPLSGRLFRVYGPQIVEVPKPDLPAREKGGRTVSPGWKVKRADETLTLTRESPGTVSLRLVWSTSGGPVSWDARKGLIQRSGTGKSPQEAAKKAWDAALVMEQAACPFRAINTRVPADQIQAETAKILTDPTAEAETETSALAAQVRALQAEIANLKTGKKRKNEPQPEMFA